MADKDPLTAIDALAEVATRGRELDVTVVGAGELRGDVEARLGRAGLAHRVVDKLPQDELAAEYRRAHVLVLSSRREGFNQATLEAMASGTPVVASDIPGVRDGVGDAGLLCPAGDVARFASAIEELIVEPARWEDLRARSLARVERFTWPEIVEHFDGLYRRAIERRRAGGR
jgi:glycosyltransferase involved in cell wall biosynthesis